MTIAQFVWCAFAVLWVVCFLAGMLFLVYAIKTAPLDPQEAQPPTQGAHGAYEEPERTRELREAYVARAIAREKKRQAKIKNAVDKLIHDAGGR